MPELSAEYTVGATLLGSSFEMSSPVVARMIIPRWAQCFTSKRGSPQLRLVAITGRMVSGLSPTIQETSSTWAHPPP